MDEIKPEAQYQQFLAEGRFMIQRSRASGRHVFYPRMAAPGSGDTDLEWVEDQVDGDYAVRKLSAYLAQGSLSLKSALDSIGAAFIGT